MKTKYTPGPWTEDGFKVTAKNKTICRVDLDGGANAFDNANAKLISAAPEMVEALQTIVNECRKELETWAYAPDNEPGNATQLMGALIETAEKALNKAIPAN
jgi:hypothetical protein